MVMLLLLLLSHFSRVQLCATPETAAHQAPLSLGFPAQYSWASLVAQLVKNLPAVWETWIRSLGREDPLEKGKATHSSLVAWRIPWTV